MTRKEAHAEAVMMLRSAVEALDQAHSYLKDANTADALHDGRTSLASTVAAMDSLLKMARETTCDDCTKLVADCQCYFAQAVR